MPQATSEPRVGTAENPVTAIPDGDWWRCGACGSRFALGVVPTKENNRMQTKCCRAWNRMPIGRARE